MNPTEVTGHDVGTLALFAAVVFCAAVARGYAGFGFSALVVSTLSFLIPVAAIVPVVIVLETIASVQMLPRVVHRIDGRILTLLVAGTLISLPAGQHLLLIVDPSRARLAVSLLVLAMVLLILSGRILRPRRIGMFYLATGLASGFATGMVAMGGLVVSTLLLGSGLRIETFRATMVALLFITGAYALVSGLLNGLATTRTLILAALMTPLLVLGIRYGQRRFDPDQAARYRKATLALLAVLAAAGLVFAVAG